MCIYLSIYLPMCIYLSIDRSIDLSNLFIYLSIQSIYLSIYANRHQAGTTPRSHVINISPPAAKGIESNAPLAQDPQTA